MIMSTPSPIYFDSTSAIIVKDGHQLELENPDNTIHAKLQSPRKISVDTDGIYRPIQYLGTKYRALPIILSKTLELIIPGTVRS